MESQTKKLHTLLDPCLAPGRILSVLKQSVYLPERHFILISHQTASAITIMMMAAALHPEAQARVQAELDNVVGRERCMPFLMTMLQWVIDPL